MLLMMKTTIIIVITTIVITIPVGRELCVAVNNSVETLMDSKTLDRFLGLTFISCVILKKS